MADEVILIVEDNEKSMKLVRDLLQFKGYRTLEAGTGAEAVSLATTHRPDLILLDIRLPDGDGVVVLDRLRADPRTATTRVVALTAFAMREDQDRLLGVGFDGYLAKPIDVAAFPEQVASFLRREG